MTDWKKWFKKISGEKTLLRRIAGIVLLLIGLLALITPFTPGSWLILVGLGFIGIRLTFWDSFKAKFKK